ncbi:MAG TPA: hypothetical protein VGP72_22110 [Planctomycetota bacterium]|jgi:hypothetical protein
MHIEEAAMPEVRPAGERIARVEAQLEALVTTTREIHAHMRQHAGLQQRYCELTEKRMRMLEQSAERTKMHLKWMKAIWLAVQGAVLGWLGLR